MLRQLKTRPGLLLVMVLVMAMARQDSAFTIYGPYEPWQTTALSYVTRFWYSPTVANLNSAPAVPGNVPYNEPGGPKNFGEGSRLNVPTLTYAYDYTFLDYYGPEGVKAIDEAFAILNKLPTASGANLALFIQQGNQQINYTARALRMLDLKSTVLQIMMQYMGLLGETHVFDLLGESPMPSSCGSAWYQVGVRNYDPITWNPTTYVNGTQYTYEIFDGCGIATTIADAMEQANDQAGGGLSLTSSAVATQEALQLGGFYLGITRDDMGGLRYLYRQNNYNYERLDANSYVDTNGIFSAFSTAETTNTLVTGWSGTVGGVEKITFLKVAYDSYVGGTNFPTNTTHYTLSILTNFSQRKLQVWRTNTAPDIVFSSANLLDGANSTDRPFTNGYGLSPATTNRSMLVAANAPDPYFEHAEVFHPSMIVSFNNVGPIYYNENPNFMGGSAFFLYPYFQFGKFDGSTNAPVAFPLGTSVGALLDLELSIPSGQNEISPWNPVVETNTTTASGTGGGTVGTGAAAAVARPGGRKSP
jgi:hypothetical protein